MGWELGKGLGWGQVFVLQWGPAWVLEGGAVELMLGMGWQPAMLGMALGWKLGRLWGLG